MEEEEANKEFLSQSRREAAERKKADEEAARQIQSRVGLYLAEQN